MTSIRQARKDWADLKNALVATEAAIAKIVKSKSWQPLGFDTFAEAWATQMRGVTIASEIRPHVAFYMFEEGYGPEWVTEHLKGITGRRTAEWRQEWADGLSPSEANRGAIRDQLKKELQPQADETVVEPHVRKKAGPASYVRFAVGSTFYQEYKRIAKELGTTVEDIARAATEEAFKSIVADKKHRRRAA